jgi:hypothetical protein
MDIELTSARDDESFTWRAAGARQPKGMVAQSLLPSGCKVGDVLRAEVEIEIDGITVVAVLPSKEKSAAEGVIAYIGPERPPAGVTTVLAGRGERRGRSDRDGFERGRDGDRSRSRGATRPHGQAAGEGRGERRDRPRAGAGAEGGPGEGRGPRSTQTGERSGRSPESERRRPGTGRSEAGRSEAGRADAGRGPGGRASARRGPARFEVGTKHRDELFAQLTPEQRPIAERLASGGLPAVRKALLDEQNRAKEEGRPVVTGESIIAIAEQLLADVKAAVWLDRAEGAVEHGDSITLRELRATVMTAAPRDEAGRALERQLREALEQRITKLRQDWETDLTQALDEGRVLQALRLSAKTPEPTARFPASLVMRLAEQAGQAMTAEIPSDRWLALLDAAAESPVRRQVKPAGVPSDPTGEIERRCRLAAGRIPALAKLLGMPIPPPPPPKSAGAEPARRAPGSRPPRPQPRPAPEAVAPEVAAAPEAPAATEAPAAPEAPAAAEAPEAMAVPEAGQPQSAGDSEG